MMIGFRATAIVLMWASVPAAAQESAQYHACNAKAKTQVELNACASEEAARTDQQLNETYRKLLSHAEAKTGQ